MKNILLSLLFISITHASETPNDLIKGVEFVMQHMPAQDKGTIDETRITQDVKLALKVKETYPWAQNTPWEVYQNDVLPYAVVNEDRCDWRQQFLEKFAPHVADCKTGTEATLKIASIIGDILKVGYSVQRNKPHQGVDESLKSGKVSCTGQSILLVCALRSIGIPARMAGILSWNHIRGNHSWVEAWCDGEWQMIEYNEKNFNTPWVMHNLTMIDETKPMNNVIATSWSKNSQEPELFFPMIWEAKVNTKTSSIVFPQEARSVPGINVTKRYGKLAKAWYEQQADKTPGSELLIELTELKDNQTHRIEAKATLSDEQGKTIAEGTTPSSTADMRQFLILKLPQDVQTATLTITHPESDQTFTQTVKHTQAPLQIIRAQMR